MKKIWIMAIMALSIWGTSWTPAFAQTFNDVSASSLNKEAIDYLKETNVIQGYGDSTFKPENRINRAEFIKIIIASKIQNPTGSQCFSDVKNEWYAPYICTAKRLGYIQGYPDGTFRPSEEINFAEASQIITKAFKIEELTSETNGEWFAGFVKALEEKRAIPSSVQYFDKELSRGEMAEMIWRLKVARKDKVSQTYAALSNQFPNITSCEALKEKFEEFQGERYPYPIRIMEGLPMVDDVMSSDAPSTAAPMDPSSNGAKSSDGGSNEYSSTNVQVTGVDEADVVKNDGKYIYFLKENTLRIVEAFPAQSMKQVSTITFESAGFHPSELFVNEDQLVVIGQTWEAYPYYSNPTSRMAIGLVPPYYNSSRTQVYIYDISNRAKPVEERKLTFDGNYFTSRRINDTMVLVLNTQPDYWIWSRVNEGQDLIPQFQDGESTPEAMVNCSDIRYFPGHAEPNYLIVASIPLANSSQSVERKVFLGSTDNVYASQTHLYVATTRTNYQRFTDWNWQNDQVQTNVYKFAMENGSITFQNRGTVPGTILNQFSMDAYLRHFRIATTIHQWQNGQNASTNNVFVLDENMKVVGSIKNIAPGEQIYSTRFLANRLYMVTFRQVDLLFVIDLKNPEKPTILGKLKIPGFSEYLHPYDANHIIGFGKDTEETKSGAIVQGFKMALFDVSDVANPKQKFVELIGDRGTYSELLTNHKALLFDKEKELLAFPITIVEEVNPETLNCSAFRYDTCPNLCQTRCIPTRCTEDSEGRALCTDDCSGLGSCMIPEYPRSETTFVGAVVYSLNSEDGFVKRGRITHYDEEDYLKAGDYFPYQALNNIQRIIYIGKSLYTISAGKVKASDINTTKEQNAVTID
ncbi:beta-propeller domain-containing protein [Candidatus Peregrinibacteria bacterium]|nr:MAG: beta-propeller domain-containing protein [Candidatus Peregrinibacteria bacterium]